jgi:hypothetical protein
MMNSCQKYFTAGVLALLTQAAFAQAPSLGAASGFAVLAGTNVTCTAGSVVGNVGVSPGSAVPFTNTGCTIAGSTPPATNATAASARTAFLSAYATLRSAACTDNSLLPTIPVSTTLFPGVYCSNTALTATDVTLTLDARGDSNAVWIFKVGAAITGTNFTVVMANGAKPCNVFWVPADAATTMTTSALKGNIVAGGAALGSITLTGGSLAGRALANVAVTMTGTGASVIGCAALADSSGSGGSSCKDDDDDDRDHHHGKKHGKKHGGHDGDRDGDRDDDRDDDRGHTKNFYERK